MAGKDSSSSDLQRSLGLRHVFVLSTGGTISAGLFFLPSFAVDKAGPSAVLAYLVAGLLALPAMLSVSECLRQCLEPAVSTIFLQEHSVLQEELLAQSLHGSRLL